MSGTPAGDAQLPSVDLALHVGQMARFVMSPTLGPEFLATIARVGEALERSAVPHALIGGQAVFFRGYRRFTKDVDVGVGTSVREAVSALVRAGLRPLRGGRLIDPLSRVEVDLVRLPRVLLPRLAGAERLDLGGGVQGRVIDLESLVALKLKLGRLQDLADVVELLKHGARPEREVILRLARGLGEDAAAAYDQLLERARREAALTPIEDQDQDALAEDVP